MLPLLPVIVLGAAVVYLLTRGPAATPVASTGAGVQNTGAPSGSTASQGAGTAGATGSTSAATPASGQPADVAVLSAGYPGRLLSLSAAAAPSIVKRQYATISAVGLSGATLGQMYAATQALPPAAVVAPLVSDMPPCPAGFYWEDNSHTYAPIASWTDPVVKDLQPGGAPHIILTDPGDTVAALGLTDDGIAGSDKSFASQGSGGPGMGKPVLLRTDTLYYLNPKNGHVVLNKDGAPQAMNTISGEASDHDRLAQQVANGYAQSAADEANVTTTVFQYGIMLLKLLA